MAQQQHRILLRRLTIPPRTERRTYHIRPGLRLLPTERVKRRVISTIEVGQEVHQLKIICEAGNEEIVGGCDGYGDAVVGT
jgi:hypothetical protein